MAWRSPSSCLYYQLLFYIYGSRVNATIKMTPISNEILAHFKHSTPLHIWCCGICPHPTWNLLNRGKFNICACKAHLVGYVDGIHYHICIPWSNTIIQFSFIRFDETYFTLTNVSMQGISLLKIHNDNTRAKVVAFLVLPPPLVTHCLPFIVMTPNVLAIIIFWHRSH